MRHDPRGAPYQWSLYNLATDPTEINDLAQSHPDGFARMMSLWEAYAEENGITPSSSLSGF